MILVDTSVWIDHLRKGNNQLATLLVEAQVACHPFIIGELCCENLRNRKTVLELLNDLPKVDSAEHGEVMELVESHKLAGQGIGWVDAHLLASALISGTPLWTADKSLKNVSVLLGVLF